MLTYIFIALIGFAKAARDLIDHEYRKSIFCNQSSDINWWYNDWTSKYKNNDPREGPKYPWDIFNFLSFTWNGWYFFETLMVLSIFGAIFSYKTFHWIDIPLFFIIRGGIFELSYRKLLRK